MRGLLGIVVFGISSICSASPRYHAVMIDDKTGDNGGIGEDGAILYARNGVGASINYNGETHSVLELSGRSMDYLPSIRAHDIWSGSTYGGGGFSYYKGSVHVLPATGTNEVDTVGFIATNGDLLGNRSKPPRFSGDPINSKPFLIHNGQMTFLSDYFVQNKPASRTPTWMSDSGYIAGYDTPFGPYNIGGFGWLKSPDSSDIVTQGFQVIAATRVSEEGDIVGQTDNSSGILFHRHQDLPGVNQYLTDPDGLFGFANQPQMNNKLQIVARNASKHGTAIFWENGTSYWLDDLVDNKDMLPVVPVTSAGYHAQWQNPYINDAGQIVATLQTDHNTFSVWRFDPVAVPEPSSLLFLGIGALALLRRRSS